jgi:CRISPR-associated exonuclease Cas4
LTADAATRLHELVAEGVTPRAQYQPKCRRCSLLSLCLPASMSRGRTASRYAAQALGGSLAEPISRQSP